MKRSFWIPFSVSFSVWILVASMLASVAGASDTGSALESLDPGTARAEVGASEGVVLVDVYADW